MGLALKRAGDKAHGLPYVVMPCLAAVTIFSSAPHVLCFDIAVYRGLQGWGDIIDSVKRCRLICPASLARG
jgi:hypothetical protein